jgi:hypothetical protein
MKNRYLSILLITLSLISFSSFSQTENTEPLLGLPGDDLDLYAVLDLFQKSPTIEEFEKTLNLEKTGINNLDLNLDEKVDFIKVVTKQKDESFSFVLQVDVSETEIQDVAVMLVDKDKEGGVTLQMVGDKDLYGKDYVVEPKTEPTPAITSNPAYAGDNPVTVSVPASTTVVVVETVPIVQYVYSPVYVPYYPPYHYTYHPPYYAAFTVMAIGIYRHNNYHHHNHYHGGHYHGGGNTVIIHNQKNYNNYNNSRKASTTVNRNKANGNYNSRNNTTGRATTGATTNRASTGAAKANRPSTGKSASTRPSTSTSPSKRSSSPAPRANYSKSPSRSMGSSPSRSGATRSMGGGGRRR